MPVGLLQKFGSVIMSAASAAVTKNSISKFFSFVNAFPPFFFFLIITDLGEEIGILPRRLI
jgi:hypothetical protein